MKTRVCALILLLITMLFVPSVSAYLPRIAQIEPRVVFTVISQRVNVNICNNIVETTIEQEIENTSDAIHPCFISLPLPDNARMTHFSAKVGDRIYISRIGEKRWNFVVPLGNNQRRMVNEQILRAGKQIVLEIRSVIPKQIVSFRFSFVEEAACSKGEFLYEFKIVKNTPISQISDNIKFNVDIVSSVRILNFNSSHAAIREMEERSGKLTLFGVRSGERSVKLRWELDLVQGEPAFSTKTFKGDCTYFSALLLPTQTAPPPQRKRVVFLVDRSGSMKGIYYANVVKTIELYLRNHLTDRDQFNICFFNEIYHWLSEDFIYADEKGKKLAIDAMKDLSASGPSNISKPLRACLSLLKDDDSYLSSIVFLSDFQDFKNSEELIDIVEEETDFSVPVYPVKIGHRSRDESARIIAWKCGTTFYHIRASKEIEQVVANISGSDELVVGRDFEVTAGDGVAVTPMKVARVYQGKPITLYGKVELGSQGKIHFKMKNGDGKWSRKSKIIGAKNTPECSFIGHGWAYNRVERILSMGQVKHLSSELKNELTELCYAHIIPFDSSKLYMAESGVKSNIDPMSISIKEHIIREHEGNSPDMTWWEVSYLSNYATEKNGLNWLKENQLPEGNWDLKKWGETSYSEAGVVGIALLAFAGAGHTQKSGRYRRTVQKAIRWLASSQDATGDFSKGDDIVNHAIATLALLEEISMAPVPRTKAVAKKALDYLVSVKIMYSGWGEKMGDAKADLLATTWCVMALRAAKFAKFTVPEATWAGAVHFVNEVTDPITGIAGRYKRPDEASVQPLAEKCAMTACSLLCRLYMGVRRDNELSKAQIEVLLENLPSLNQPGVNDKFFLYCYIGSLAMFLIEGDPWEKWSGKMKDMLVKGRITSVSELEGSWDPTDKAILGKANGRVFSTSLAVLALEVFYRYDIIRPPKKK